MLLHNYANSDWLRERVILAPKNDDVDLINSLILNKVRGEVHVYSSFDSAMTEQQAVEYPLEFLNSLKPAGFPPHRLYLKRGTPVMMLRNLDPPKLCNGTRLIVKEIHANIIEAKILTGSSRGEVVFVPRIPFIPVNDFVSFRRLQFPLRVCFAMTINKSQGQTLKVTGIDLHSPVFSHGQLYVGCSRVGKPSNLFVYAPGGLTSNVVYPNALTDPTRDRMRVPIDE